jgi:hypothetical protein
MSLKINLKRCFTCKNEKMTSEFYSNNSQKIFIQMNIKNVKIYILKFIIREQHVNTAKQFKNIT